jgi:hypothetical protein
MGDINASGVGEGPLRRQPHEFAKLRPALLEMAWHFAYKTAFAGAVRVVMARNNPLRPRELL